MKNQPEYIAFLIKKLFDNSITTEEKAALQEWLDASAGRRDFLNELNKEDNLFEETISWMALESSDQQRWEDELSNRTLAKIRQEEQRHVNQPKPKLIWMPYAAAIALVATLSGYFGLQYLTKKDQQKNITALHQVKPGTNKARLILANGQVFQLKEDQGLLEITKDHKIQYANGEVVIDLDSLTDSYNIAQLAIPKAGQYQLKLSDDSKIWINADSKLDFPLEAHHNPRILKLEGEAYFEVAKLENSRNTPQPFLVNSKDQQVQVTGTQFNISAYPEDEDHKTTLVEGSVHVKSAMEELSLKPNEQASLRHKNLQKKEVNIAEDIAWKNHKFLFDEMELREAMKLISRWYDLEIIYKKDLPETYFYGEISRDQKLQDVLKILEAGGIKFEYQYKKGKNYLTVLP